MTTIALLTSLGAMTAFGAQAADNQAAIAFGRANAGKFRTEVIEVQGVAIGKTITVTGSLDDIDVTSIGLKYNPDSRIATLSSGAVLGGLKIFEKCTPKGAFVGQNAYGVKKMVKREDCERFFVSAHPYSKYVKLRGKSVAMTPDQFREIQANGLVVEVDFTIKHKSDITVTFRDVINEAKIDSPTESRMRLWIINGDFEALRWKLPGTGEVVEIWKNAPKGDGARPADAETSRR